MVICQTLWTNNKNILEDSFGWLTPQHHLMAWSLSILKLAQHYDDIHLYTDTGGKNLLIDQLGLPYTTVFNDYDNLDCNSNLWAFPKLLTYARQNQPFLHIDGDVFVWHPFKKELLSSGLIAQNLENGTEYYRKILSPFAELLKYTPHFLKQNLLSHNIQAYNAGILGGHDIDFFRCYAATAKDLIEKNDQAALNSNFNIVFEQVLFFSMVQKEKKTVNSLLDGPIDDYGYHKKYFAEFPYADQLKYLHIIGTHKRDKDICDWLARYLRQENEDIFLRIVSLFKKHHYFYSTRLKEIYPISAPLIRNKFSYSKSEEYARSLNPEINFSTNAKLSNYVENSGNNRLKELYNYEKRIKRICTKFRKINFPRLKQIEEDSIHATNLLLMLEEDRMEIKLYRNPYIEIIYTTFDWTNMKCTEDDNVKTDKNSITISVIPELFFSGYREVVLDESCVNIVVLTEKGTSYKNLLEKIRSLFPPIENEKEYKAFCDLIFLKVGFLIRNKILLVRGLYVK